MKFRFGQFVVLIDDFDFCMGIILFWVDIFYIFVFFGNILYYLGKLYIDLKLFYFMYLVVLNLGVKISLFYFYYLLLQINLGFFDLFIEIFFCFY